MNKVKEFSTSNEILVLTKDKRDGSKEDDSFKVATSDDASIAVSFQMSYRYDPDTVIDTYKRFKGMDGEDIIENRVKTVLKSKISEITTDYSMMDIYSGNRSELNNAITEYLNKDFHKKYGIEVLDASIVDVHPDKKLKQAIDNRVTALQEKQQAQAEQEKVKVQKETEKLQAEADAQIELTKAEADAKKAKVKAAAEAENTKIKAKAQAEANKELSASITDELIKMKEAGINCYNIVGNGQSTDRRYYLIECKPNTKYYITFVNSNNNIFIGVADKNYIGIKDVSVFENITSRTFTTGNNVKFIVLNADGTSNICISEDNATFEPYHEQTIQLPYTLNAIPVASGGNVTIDGQQYIADRVVEKDGVFGIERNIREIHTNTKTMNNTEEYPGWNKVEGISDTTYYNEQSVGASKMLTFISNFTQTTLCQNNIEPNNIVFLIKDLIGYSQSDLIAKAIDVDMYIRLQNAIFEPLPVDMQAKLRTLVTNYPVTNISVNSEQLDGYTVFNYPISMANGWNYVKQQLNDNRDYIYDMDLQSAEAYVNSEYAVALTELEV